jgi:hypothetical protein
MLRARFSLKKGKATGGPPAAGSTSRSSATAEEVADKGVGGEPLSVEAEDAAGLSDSDSEKCKDVEEDVANDGSDAWEMSQGDVHTS